MGEAIDLEFNRLESDSSSPSDLSNQFWMDSDRYHQISRITRSNKCENWLHSTGLGSLILDHDKEMLQRDHSDAPFVYRLGHSSSDAEGVNLLRSLQDLPHLNGLFTAPQVSRQDWQKRRSTRQNWWPGLGRPD